MAKFIVIEGIDGAGKSTIADELRLHCLRQTGVRSVQIVRFPQYAATQHGKLVGRYLNGEFGQLANVSPWLSALLYAGDRREYAPTLSQALMTNDVVMPPVVPAPSTPPAALPPVSHERGAVVAVIVAILVIGVGVAWLWLGREVKVEEPAPVDPRVVVAQFLENAPPATEEAKQAVGEFLKNAPPASASAKAEVSKFLEAN